MYVMAFHLLGFVPSTWLYTLFVTVIFRRKPAVIAVLVPVLSTLLIYLLFQIGLGVQLPGGPLEDLLSGSQWQSWELVVRGR
jgi:hypothetical protein